MGQKTVLAGDIVASNFSGGLDTLDTPAEIPSNFAQDLLNINIQPGGASIFKRDGYGLFQSLPSPSTAPVHGGYHFQQVGGNDVQLWGSDIYLSGSVNDAAFVKLATGTLSATWQCADSQGYAYCLDSAQDTCVKTDGSLANTTFQTSVPLGTILTFTPLQLVVAGVAGNENTVYVSQQNAFTNFTIGVLPSSSFTEPIASPGSRITHLAYYFGKLFWWKDQSFGYATFTNQNDWQLTIVSNQIGTLDNSDAFWNSSGFDSGAKFTGTAQANAEQSPGGIFFRGQDNHFYVYDGYYLTRISRPITPTVTAASRKKPNSWTQTTQTDFQNGGMSPAGSLDLTTIPGSVTPAKFTAFDNVCTSFNLGTYSNMACANGAISLTTNNSGNLTNPDFESSFTGNWNDPSGVWNQVGAAATVNCGGGIVPEHGTGMTEGLSGTATTITAGDFQVIDLNNNVLATQSFLGPGCAWTQYTLTVGGSNIGKRVKFRIRSVFDSPPAVYLTTSDSYILGGNVTFWSNFGTVHFLLADRTAAFIDNVQLGSSTITTGNFTSRVFDSTFLTGNNAIVPTIFTTSVNSSTPTFIVQTAPASGGPWTERMNSVGTNQAGVGEFIRYISTISVSSSESALSNISAVAILAASSGTYYSAVNNAPNLTSWGTLVLHENRLPESATYFTRASTTAFAVFSATPTWVPQSSNSLIVASTGTYMQFREDMQENNPNDSPTLDDFQFNWFEGTAKDKAYITYFNDAIWFSVSSSSSAATNNRIFYWDLLNGAWLIYDIPSNGFQIENNALYFGDPLTSNIYKYGGVPTDSGTIINSYWRSKAFFAPSTLNPYQPPSFEDAMVQKEFQSADFVLGESSTTLTYTYTLDSKTSTVFTFTAFDPAASLIQRNFLLPAGKIGKYYDFKLGDNSGASPWRLMGHRVHYNALNWKPVLN